jgi:hypothetical protein
MMEELVMEIREEIALFSSETKYIRCENKIKQFSNKLQNASYCLELMTGLPTKPISLVVARITRFAPTCVEMCACNDVPTTGNL